MLIVLIFLTAGLWSKDRVPKEKQYKAFIGLETLVMVLNDYADIAGEVGYRFNKRAQLRFTLMDIKKTETHFVNSYRAKGIKGDNVQANYQGYELHFDLFLSKCFYLSASAGYYKDSYKHLVSDKKISNKSYTIGSGLGFKKCGILISDQLYFNLNIPFRYYFNNIEKVCLGNTSIECDKLINNIWFFIGYKF